MSTPSDRCEIHGAKRYLPYEEHEGWRAFCDAENPACAAANYAVLKMIDEAEESLEDIEAYYEKKGVPFTLRQKADSAPLDKIKPLLTKRGYTVQYKEIWRLIHCLQPSPLLLVHDCRTQAVTLPISDALEDLLKERCDGEDWGVTLLNRQISSGARAFVAYNREDVPVSICTGEGYGSAFCLTDVFTVEEHRNQGYGAAAVMAMLAFANDIEKGYEDLFLYVEDGPARRLYEKTGFRGMCTQSWSAQKSAPAED